MRLTQLCLVFSFQIFPPSFLILPTRTTVPDAPKHLFCCCFGFKHHLNTSSHCVRACVCHIPEEFRSLRQITAGSHNSHSLEMLVSVEVPTLTYRHFCRRGGSSPSQIGQYGSFRVNYAVSAFVTIDGIAASGFPDHVSRVTRCRCCAISICQPTETHLGHNTSK